MSDKTTGGNTMTKQEVIDLMASSTSMPNWVENCDKVKAAFDGQHPDFWYQEIILAGLADKVPGGSSKLTVISHSLPPADDADAADTDAIGE